MNPIDHERMGEMAVDALERAAFLLAEVCAEGDLPDPLRISRRARIAVTGIAEGHLWIESDDGFARELAANMLGEELENVDPAVGGRDALLEFANLMGGSLAVELGGTDRRYGMGLPEALDGDDQPIPGAGVGTEVLLTSDEGAVRIRWIETTEAAGDAGDAGDAEDTGPRAAA